MTGIYYEYGEEKQKKRKKQYPVDSYKLFPMKSFGMISKLRLWLIVKKVKKFKEAKKIAEQYGN